MSKLKELKAAIDLLDGIEDIDAVKNALRLIGEPVDTSSNSAQSEFEVGKSYFIRTVTMYQVGRVTSISGKFITLEDASWVADTGRFSDALKTGKLNEVEPVEGPYRVSIDAIVDFFDWNHKLPLEQK